MLLLPRGVIFDNDRLHNGEFYVHGSVRRWSISIIVQRDATQSSLFIILRVRSTRFGCQPHPPSRVHKTVTTASGTGHIFCAATSLQRGEASLTTLEGGCCTVPEAVVTVLRTLDDGCSWYPKHVEWTRRIINRLLCVASRWTIIDIHNSDLMHLPLLQSTVFHLLVLTFTHNEAKCNLRISRRLKSFFLFDAD